MFTFSVCFVLSLHISAFVGCKVGQERQVLNVFECV